MGTIAITGELATGVGQATGFTQLDWARAAFIDRLGIDPWPGTVNLTVRNRTDLDCWQTVRSGDAVIISPPRSDWCDARCFHARIVADGMDPIPAAIVLPDVESYAADQIELIAPVNVRETLDVCDGDAITIHVELAAGGPAEAG